MLADKLRIITIKTRLILLLTVCIIMLISGGIICIFSFSMLAKNGIDIQHASEKKLVKTMQSQFHRTALMIDLQTRASEFMVITDKQHFAEVEKNIRKLNKFLDSRHKKNIFKLKKQIKFFLVRHNSFIQNYINFNETQTRIAKELSDTCKKDMNLSAVSMALLTLNKIRLQCNSIVNNNSDISVLQQAQKETSGKIDALAGKLDKTIAFFHGEKTLSSIKNLFYDLDDAISSMAAIKIKVIKTQIVIKSLINKVKDDLLSSNGKIESGTSVLADKGIELARHITWLMAFGVGAGIIFLIITGFLFIYSITMPLNAFKKFIAKVSTGDLTERLEIKGRDELASITGELNNLTQSLEKMIKESVDGVETIVLASSELNNISNQLSNGAEETALKAGNVTRSADEMNNNMNSVALAIEQASSNVSTVASGAEEMSVTISEIARNAASAQDITAQAVSQGNNAVSRIDEFGKAAREIGNVTETINEISSQTNLLALNATIEAARAGEAGKGFAVVANEIKELANQTAIATDEIATKIKGIQKSTKTILSQINDITQINGKVDDIVSIITTAVDQQAVTTKEIAENIAHTSVVITEVNDKVIHTTEVSGNIARDIADVDESASDMKHSSSQVHNSSEELNQLSEKLNGIMSQFKV